MLFRSRAFADSANVIQAMVVILVAAPLLVKELKRLNPAGWSRKTKKEVA